MSTYEIVSIDKDFQVYSEEISTYINLEFLNLKIGTVLPSDSITPSRTIQNIKELF